MAGNYMVVSPYLKGQSLSSSFTSQPFPVGQHDRFAIQIRITGNNGLSGTLKMQVSINDVHYVDVSDATFSISGPDDFIVSVTQFAYRFIRLNYTAQSGTGTLTAEVNSVNFAR